MKIKTPEKRLSQFWGSVDRKHISLIAHHVTGVNVLDLGCGLGTTVDFLSNMDKNCIGVDSDHEVVSLCNKKFPHLYFENGNAEKLVFDNEYFDTIILRDALHHLFQEANFSSVRSEIIRVSKPKSRLIFFDPNVNFIVRTMRKLSFHKDAECTYETAKTIMQGMGYEIIHDSFNTVYSLPLSGGYVGINFVPNNRYLWYFLIRSEQYIEKLINKMGLGRILCWRYLLVGEKIAI